MKQQRNDLKDRFRVKLNDFFSSGAQIEVRIVVDDLVGQGLAVLVAQDGDAWHLVQSLRMDFLGLWLVLMILKQIHDLGKQTTKSYYLVSTALN